MKHDSDILKQIKNYFMRRRNAAEAFEFEREIERDSFLYEAIEGIEEMHMSDLQQALDELEERVNRKATATIFDKINWRIAAMIAVIVVAGSSFVILGLNTKNKPAIATDESEENREYTPRTDDLEFATIADSIHLIESYIEPEETVGNSLAVEEPMMAMQEEVVEQNVPAPTEAKKQEQNRDAALEFKISEKAPDFKKSNIQAKSEGAALAEESAKTDNDVYYNWTQIQEAEISSVSKEEVQRMAAPAMDSYTNVKPTSAAAPSNGSTAYQQYIASNLRKTDEMKSGSVTVSFEFDKNGQPKKVNVVKSLCEACDQEAIRLIENGPAWNVEDKKERVNYTITIP